MVPVISALKSVKFAQTFCIFFKFLTLEGTLLLNILRLQSETLIRLALQLEILLLSSQSTKLQPIDAETPWY